MRLIPPVTFGTDIRKALSGADLYVRVFQILSLLPVLYMFVAAGYPAVMTSRSLFSVLFDAGMSALPRAESLLLAALYRHTSSEICVYFALLAAALLLGILGNRCFRDNHNSGRTTRFVFAGLIAADLIIRLLPFACNSTFGLPAAVFGFAVRLACLGLIILDLRDGCKSTSVK